MAQRSLTEKRAKLEERVAGRQNHMNNINGVVLTLGQGDTGQLGLGPDIMERSKPALVKDLSRVKAVCAGGMHTVCLTKEGKVYTFGKYIYILLGLIFWINIYMPNVICRLVYDRNLVSVSATETKIKSRYRFQGQNFFCLNLNFPHFKIYQKISSNMT